MGLLEVRRLSVRYGGVHANDDISLDVDEGAIVGLIGPNGAGKTTLIDAVTGFTPASTGSVRFAASDLTGAPPALRSRAGIARTFQSVELFDDLSVGQNLSAAAVRPRWYGLIADLVAPSWRRQNVDGHVSETLDALGLAGIADEMPSRLSHGQRAMVGVARALATRPRLLVLDEPAAGLDPDETRQLGVHLRRIRASGVAILLVDHDVDLVFDLCDWVYVLDFGRVIASGPPSQVRRDQNVITAYLGAGNAPHPGNADA